MTDLNLSKEEIENAKNYGFIILGKTGVGKSNFLNSLTGRIVTKSERSLKPVTVESSVIYHKLNNGNVISLIDTPGLSDPKQFVDKEYDEKTLENIKKCIRDNQIHIKGILFLTSFQFERFDADEQKILIKYNEIFPLKKFWEHVIIIFTHYYSDTSSGISTEEIKQLRAESNTEVFEGIMERVKNVSNVIQYNKLDIKYTNFYFPIQNKLQKQNNNKYRIEIEKSLIKLYDLESLFHKIEIIHQYNYKYFDDDDKKYYFGEVEIIGYFDINEKPIKEVFKKIDVKEIDAEKKIDDLPAPEFSVEVVKAGEDENKNLDYIVENNPNDSYYSKLFNAGKGLLFGGASGAYLGLIIGGIIGTPLIPVIGGGILLGTVGTIIGAKA